MIWFEAQVFDYVYDKVKDLVPAGCFKNVYNPAPPKFPFATLREISNTDERSRMSTSTVQEYATVGYEANVYAEDRYQAMEIMCAIDSAMYSFNFERISSDSPDNLLDPELFRVTNRYRAGVSKDGVFFRP